MPTKEDHEVHMGCTYKYAFMAYLSSSMSVGAKQHIKFDRVTVNYGNGYTSYVGTYRFDAFYMIRTLLLMHIYINILYI